MKTERTSKNPRNLLFWCVIIGVLMFYAYYESGMKEPENEFPVPSSFSDQ